MTIVELINDAIATGSLNKFQKIIEKYRNDINQHVFIYHDSDTRLNILHILSVYHESENLTNGNSDSKIFYKFIDSMIRIDPNFDVNYPASVDHCYNVTAAHLAVKWQNKSILQALIDYGCDLLICDCNGENVQDYAHNSGDQSILQMIQNGIYRSIEKRFLDQSSSSPTPPPISTSFDNTAYLSFRKNSSSLDSPSLSPSPTSTTNFYPWSTPMSNQISFGKDSQDQFTNVSDISLNESFDSEVFKSFDQQHTPTSYSKSQTTIIEKIVDQTKSKTLMEQFNELDLEDANHNDQANLSNNSGSSHATAITTVYHDDDLELIEQCYEPVNIPISIGGGGDDDIHLNDSWTSSSQKDQLNDSNESVQSIDELILKMNDKQLFEELDEIGYNPGPINDGTRKYYQRKYHLLLKEKNRKNGTEDDKNDIKDESMSAEDRMLISKMANYNIEFDSIRSRTFPFKEANEYETELIKLFQNSFDRCQKKKKSTYFVYLLLDPTITKNLPSRINFLLNNPIINDNKTSSSSSSFAEMFGNILNDYTLFYRFIASIFYVGKGQANRPYQHFIDAFKEKNLSHEKPMSPKTDRIWSIWNQGLGPISLHFFYGITADEAHTREALIIETLSLYNLTNQIYGTYRQKLPFNRRVKNILGTYMLYKFFIIHLLNGERQIKKDKLNEPEL